MGGMHMGQGPGIREFNRLYKELDDLYHNLALRQGLSDSASIILYALYLLGDGCLQRDICDLSYISKQTINSSIRRLEQDGYLYLQPGRGRDMHICLTPEGRRLVEEKAAPGHGRGHHAQHGSNGQHNTELQRAYAHGH